MGRILINLFNLCLLSILNVPGEDEILTLEEMKSAGRGYSRSAAYSRRAYKPKKPTKTRKTIRRSQIENAMADLSDLMNQIRICPHADGIKVSRIKPRSIFRRMGLRNGDIITAIDGQQITIVEDALGLYEGLSSASKVALSLKRRGRDRIINYTIR
jgi:general secretion pathway protein C